MDKLYIPLLLADYLASDFFSYRFDSIWLGRKLEITRRAGAAIRYLLQMSHFITTGVVNKQNY